jgi:hypothetical protein
MAHRFFERALKITRAGGCRAQLAIDLQQGLLARGYRTPVGQEQPTSRPACS